ncbi:hypothetical protein B9Z55_001456 [Caenorhabditis nigoni]|uniref:Uncharacterized protein n=1 Tax=Caenorhabditis nigoni TaxID=1611254 RepID=A0A2G5VG02_9PELO|nr:hypothetical protein B9Z55_001456 [Caenorhabditis nigoni]
MLVCAFGVLINLIQDITNCQNTSPKLLQIIEQQRTPPEGPTQKLEKQRLRLRNRNARTADISDNGLRKTDDGLQTTDRNIFPQTTDTDNGVNNGWATDNG